MEEGIVVERADTQILVWINRLSRPILASVSLSKSELNIGNAVRLNLSNGGEITSLEERSSRGTVTVTGNDLTVKLCLIFPPQKLLSKIGMKCYSPSVGLISVNESWRILFDHASDTTVYEANTEWSRSAKEFVLSESQELIPLSNVDSSPTYLDLLKESPWADLIEKPTKPDDVLQYIIDDFVGSDSSSSDEERAVRPSDFVKMGVLYRRMGEGEWEVFLLDCKETRNQWMSITESLLARGRFSRRPFVGAVVEIDLNPRIIGKVDEWCVVDSDDSLIVNTEFYGTVMLDVAVRAEIVVRLGERMVTRLHNRRVMDVYDYNNILGMIEAGDIVRVLVKRVTLESNRSYSRHEWIVHGYGRGVAVLPKNEKEKRRQMEIDRAIDEFRFIEYANERDWDRNSVLMHYKRMMRETAMEEERLEKEKERKTEREREEELEFLRHKEQLECEREERRRRTREEEEEFIRHKKDILGEESASPSPPSSPVHTPLTRPGLLPFGQSLNRTRESLANSTHSSDASQITVIPACLPSLDHNLNETTDSLSNTTLSSNLSQTTVIPARSQPFGVNLDNTRESFSNSTLSSILTTTTVLPAHRTFAANLNNTSASFSSESRDSGNGSSTKSQSEREKRAVALLRRMYDVVRKNDCVRTNIDEEDVDFIDDLRFVISEYDD